MMEPTEFQKKAIVVALKKMFRADGHFSICDFDSMVEVLGITVPRREYEALRLFHCLSWWDTDAETKRQVFDKVLELLHTEPLQYENLLAKRVEAKAVVVEAKAVEAPKTLLHRLLGA